MTERLDARPEILGDPPTAVRRDDELPADAIAQMLTAPSAPALMEKLGITGQDAEELAPLLPRAAEDAEILAEVTRTANLLRAGAGLTTPTVGLESFAQAQNALQERLAPGEGLIAILAHLVSTSTVREWHAARGLTAQQSWLVLADLGQQMRIHRRSSGRLGLHQVGWTALNWAGRLFHLGRLQFDLHRIDEGTGRERWVVGTHIPADGPLDPDAVEDSFARATAFFTEHFGDLDTARPADAPRFGHEFRCESWLMNPVLVEELGAESNIGAFVSRWEIIDTAPGADGAAFFVFGVRPPYDPATLPRSTRLERAVAERLADGRGWDSGTGALVR
ncbi:acyltransferase domain-containing protein [Brachybacterium sp. GCM10030267]|uniref:acyltransferase domain-containing protein n=1 Tax=Brachybacterium sp. GCM10030267 TaxID=3273381 RepID=UPI00361734A8